MDTQSSAIPSSVQEEIYEDVLYEEPDLEVVSSARQSAKNEDISQKKRAKSLQKEAKIVSIPEKDYETISCSLELDADGSSDQNGNDAVDGRVDDKGDSSEPKYTSVDKAGLKKNRLINNSTREQVDEQNRVTDGKIDVFITKTAISSRLSCEDCDHRNENPDEEAEKKEDNNKAAVDLLQKEESVGDLYAQVDMQQKRADQAKKGLYAKVNKVKTGVIHYYDDQGNEKVMPSQEYEDGHYTKIPGMCSCSIRHHKTAY